MLKIGAVIEIARAVVKFCQWAVEAVNNWARRRKQEQIHEAHENAANAKTREEKIEAARQLENAVGLSPRDRNS